MITMNFIWQALCNLVHGHRPSLRKLVQADPGLRWPNSVLQEPTFPATAGWTWHSHMSQDWPISSCPVSAELSSLQAIMPVISQTNQSDSLRKWNSLGISKRLRQWPTEKGARKMYRGNKEKGGGWAPLSPQHYSKNPQFLLLRERKR